MDNLNKLICIDCVEGMKQLPSDSIPLTVTSPPWDSLRTYDGHKEYDFEATAQQLWRITARGGVVCWHVADQIIDESETGTSAVQKLYFRKLGFRLHQTLVIHVNAFHRMCLKRYGSPPQFVYVMSKGRPRYFSPIRDVPNKHAGIQKVFQVRKLEVQRRIEQYHVRPRSI